VAIEDIFRALEKQADEECVNVLEQAKAQAGSIAADAADEANDIREQKLHEAEAAAKRKSAQRMNSARLQRKKEFAGVKGRAVEAVFAAALEKLSMLRGDKGYRDLLAALTKEAASGIEGDIEVLVDPADKAIAQDILKDIGIDAPVKADDKLAVGVIVTTASGRIARRNTLEDRLGKAKNQAQAQVAEILFG